MADRQWAGFTSLPPTPHYIPLKPMSWPQDRVRVPNGYGSLTPIDRGNRFVGQEYYAVQINFENIDGPTTVSQVFNVESYGDFWVTNISMTSLQGFGNNNVTRPGAGVALAARTLTPLVFVKDITTGYQIFEGGIRGTSLINYTAAILPGGNLGPNAASRSTLPIPYCFLRDGGFEVTLINQNAAPNPGVTPRNYYILLEGWREYANAGQ